LNTSWLKYTRGITNKIIIATDGYQMNPAWFVVTANKWLSQLQRPAIGAGMRREPGAMFSRAGNYQSFVIKLNIIFSASHNPV